MRYDIYLHLPADVREEYDNSSGIFAGGRDSILPPKKEEKEEGQDTKQDEERDRKEIQKTEER